MKPESTKDKNPKDALPRRYTRERFLVDTLEPETGRDTFDIIEKRLVRIELDGFVWIKRGSTVAYHGDIKFRRERVLKAEGIKLASGPIRSALKREIVPFSRAEGKGCLYISDEGAHSQVVRLEGGTVYIVSSHLLAFEPTLKHEILLAGGVGVLAGGIFVIKLSGNGLVALSLKGVPLTMKVKPDDPISTDPTATIGWTGTLWPELKTDVEMRTLLLHGGGEAIQMLFRGEGFVIVHAKTQSEEMRAGVAKRVTSKVSKVFGV
ncbi:MAG TPA: AIM24 family protein [Blastocatellia bacterium]|jgi:uncharacterized protein (AIM24 family)|nr:AIM24 family protein [Blastocatellia bacterium]